MTAAPRVAVSLHPQQTTFAGLRDAALRAEDLGADVVFVWDHFFPLYDDRDGPRFEAYATLAAIAQATERAQLGALVSCNSYRNPNLLADMACTIDHVSGGRFILGIGAGWFQRDYDEYGYEFGTIKDRVRALREALPLIAARLGKLNPGPVNGQLPVLIAGSGEQVMLRLVARYAQLWHGFGEPDVIRHKCEVIDRHCADLGRDPAEIERSCNVKDATGTHLDAYYAAGASLIVTGAGGPDYDLSSLERMVRWRDAATAG